MNKQYPPSHLSLTALGDEVATSSVPLHFLETASPTPSTHDLAQGADKVYSWNDSVNYHNKDKVS